MEFYEWLMNFIGSLTPVFTLLAFLYMIVYMKEHTEKSKNNEKNGKNDM